MVDVFQMEESRCAQDRHPMRSACNAMLRNSRLCARCAWRRQQGSVAWVVRFAPVRPVSESKSGSQSESGWRRAKVDRAGPFSRTSCFDALCCTVFPVRKGPDL